MHMWLHQSVVEKSKVSQEYISIGRYEGQVSTKSPSLLCLHGQELDSLASKTLCRSSSQILPHTLLLSRMMTISLPQTTD